LKQKAGSREQLEVAIHLLLREAWEHLVVLVGALSRQDPSWLGVFPSEELACLEGASYFQEENSFLASQEAAVANQQHSQLLEVVEAPLVNQRFLQDASEGS
jgi:hypothetical protein